MIRGFIRAFYPGDAHERCARRGTARARSHCRFATPLIHFIPDSLTYSVPLFLKRQCDRALGTAFSISDCDGLPWRPPRRVMASRFTSFADFEGAILASSALPFVIGARGVGFSRISER